MDSATRSPTHKPQRSSHSVLGALLSTAASALKKPPAVSPSPESALRPLASSQEDAYTRTLLFPDPALLNKPKGHAYPFQDEFSAVVPTFIDGYDSRRQPDLQSPRDVRVLIAQEGSGLQPSVVLFDSKPPSSSTISRLGVPPGDSDRATRSANGPVGRSEPFIRPRTQHIPLNQHSSSASPVQATTSAITGGAFERARMRGVNTGSVSELNQRPLASESVGDMKLLLDCIFGLAPLSYRGDSTKLHVFPSEELLGARGSHGNSRDGSGSWGRAEGRRKSQLAQSITPNDFASIESERTAPFSTVKSADKRTLLLTRTFSVDLPARPSYASYEPTQLNQIRTLMYAVALVMHVPVSARPPLARSPQSGSFPTKESYSSSVDSDTRSGWLFLDPNCGLNTLSSSSLYGSDVDDCVDVVTQRWDIVTRVLSSIQILAKAKIACLLQQAAANSMQPSSSYQVSRAKIIEDRMRSPSTSDRVPAQANKKILVQLPSGALALDSDIIRAANGDGSRLAVGLQIPKVVTGQGRWGIWRDEARWIERWGGGKDHHFFFFNLLTAFLGTHLEWLEHLGIRYSRQQNLLHRVQPSNHYSVRSRTVIVGNERMAARRLIFLLASFLPPASTSWDNALLTGGGTPSSSAGYSQSVSPTSASRRGSLRRTVKRKGETQRASTDVRPCADVEDVLVYRGAACSKLGAPELLHGSNSGCGKTASLPIPDRGMRTRKSSATTIATIIPATTTPHFTSIHDKHSSGNAAEAGQVNSSSVASVNLIRTLERGENTDHTHVSADSQSTGRWGSLISGFWSRGESSATHSTTTMQSEEEPSPKAAHLSPNSAVHSNNKLAQMVKQVETSLPSRKSSHEGVEDDEIPNYSSSQASSYSRMEARRINPQLTSRAIPTEAKTPESPLKLSVDEKDGIIDVDIQLRGLLSSSFGSPMHSPSNSGFLTGAAPEDGSSSPNQFFPLNPQITNLEGSVYVAGYLKTFHPDYVLQAVHPYPDLESDVKRSMSAELKLHHHLNPSAVPTNSDTSPDVAVTLIADLHSFTIKRLCIQRRLNGDAGTAPYRGSSNGDAFGPASATNHQQAPVPATTSHGDMDEFFTEEPVFDMDPTLIEAVERVMAESNPSSVTVAKSTPGISSRSPSEAELGASQLRQGREEVSRHECEGIILGALEEVVRTVVLERTKGETDLYQRGNGTNSPRRSTLGRTKHIKESSLRDGLRKWLDEVEDPL